MVRREINVAVQPSGCLESDAFRDRDGYARTNVWRYGRKIQTRHVLAWVEANGRLPGEGLQINHHYELTESNTRIRPTDGARCCRTCERDRMREVRARV